MFSFDIGGFTLSVTPNETGLIRLIAVVSGFLELRPHEIGHKLGDVVDRGAWLAACRATTEEAAWYFNGVFDALCDGPPGEEVAAKGELVVAASLLSGARKSEKLAFAFECLGGGGDALGGDGVARLLGAVLVGILAASGCRGSPDAVGAAARAEAGGLADEVVSRGSSFPNGATFDDFGNWYNSRGFQLAPWLELLDLSKWPTRDDGEEREEAPPEPSRAVVAFELATDDGTVAQDADQRVVLRAAFSATAVARLRALVVDGGTADCEASVLCGEVLRAATPAGRVDARACEAALGAFAPRGARGPAGRGLARYVHRAFVRDETLGADAGELAAGLALLCSGTKSAKLAVAWEVVDGGAGGDRRDGALTRRGLWRYLRSFLVALLALASLPDDVDDPGDAPVDVHDDADDAAVHLAATIFDDAGCDDLIAFDDFADWYTDGGFKLASWLELLDLSKWVL